MHAIYFYFYFYMCSKDVSSNDFNHENLRLKAPLIESDQFGCFGELIM